ncbi:MAG: thioredoxin fold domain-containing protein [Bacteroidales bacterium]|nr:thioredoxin fold domain-containing protein [Bacteroidales bacterium]
MKTIITFIVAMLSAVTISIATEPAGGNPTETVQGIQFYEGSWAEALKLAKKENKLVFLDIYATWCGPCKKLKANTFPDEAVGEFYNANFINLALDGEKGEGRELARQYAIKGYPTLLFVDHTGAVVARTTGYHSPDKFLGLGKEVTARK